MPPAILVSCEPARGKDTGGGASGEHQSAVGVLQPCVLAFGAPPEANKAMLLQGTVRSKYGASTRAARQRQRAEPARCQAKDQTHRGFIAFVPHALSLALVHRAQPQAERGSGGRGAGQMYAGVIGAHARMLDVV
eukprot:6211482-Pleurochrysis_carterae.AAC.1